MRASLALFSAASLRTSLTSSPTAQPRKALDREGGAGREPRLLFNFSLTLKHLPMFNLA